MEVMLTKLQIHAHPALLRLAKPDCRDVWTQLLPVDNAAQQWTSPQTTVHPIMLAAVNESSRLHARTERLQWLTGDIWEPDLPAALRDLAEAESDGMQCTSSARFQCYRDWTNVRRFYAAWRYVLQALRAGASASHAELRSRTLIKGLTIYGAYLRSKDVSEPLLLQEAQFARLYRVSQSVYMGQHSSQCVCQLQFATILSGFMFLFRDLFRMEQVGLQPTADPARDAKLRALSNPHWCATEDSNWLKYTVGVEGLTKPDADQVTSPEACLPHRILASILCGQSAALWKDGARARSYYISAQLMFLFALDCFDPVVSPMAPPALDLFVFFAHLHPHVSIVSEDECTDRVDQLGIATGAWNARRVQKRWLPDPQYSRLSIDRTGRSAFLPPLCLDGFGHLFLRLDKFSSTAMYITEGFETGPLVPLGTSLPAGGLALESSFALLLYVDGPSWSNLGHSIIFLLPYVVGAYQQVQERGGMREILRKRQRVQLYLMLPEGEQAQILRMPTVLLQWLDLLSPHLPTLLLGRGDVAAPEGLQLLDPAATRCHAAGQWGRGATRMNHLRKMHMDFFVHFVINFPPWHMPRDLLLKKVWGRKGREGRDDVCLLPRSNCLRVLLVQRGTSATAARPGGPSPRRIVNIGAIEEYVLAKYPRDMVALATVELEDYTIQEEVALAGLTDVLIGACGSAMWWAIFMPEEACVLWLFPRMHFEQTRDTPFASQTDITWSRDAYLEYGVLRRLWHVKIHGVVPSPAVMSNYTGTFELDADVERRDYLAFMSLDIYVDLSKFSCAFDGIVIYLQSRPWPYNTSRY